MGICRLCGNDRELIDSHIIPKAFHRDLQGDANSPPLIIGGGDTFYPKRSPGGVYEKEMLCRPCEDMSQIWDDYGAKCFLQNLDSDAQPMCSPLDSQILAYRCPWDEEKIRMFALSLLWRAAVTQNEIFDRVDLGPFLPRLQQRIKTGESGSPDDFSVMLVRWTTRPENARMKKAQMSPYRVKLCGVNEVKMFLAGCIFHVKVDQRPYGKPFDEIILRPGRPVYMCARELEGSKDILALRPAPERYASLAKKA